jgi:23S rRNA (guanosine2251-2'-O)-methyltransferase
MKIKYITRMKSGPVDSVVCGIHAAAEIIASGADRIDHVYFEQDRRSAELFELMKSCRRQRLSYSAVPAARLNLLAGTPRHQGVVVACSAKAYASADELDAIVRAAPAPLLFLPASIEDPRNLGALIRTCAAFGVHAMLLERKNTAPLSDIVARAAAGALEHMPIVKPRNLEGVVAGFRERGFRIVGAAGGAHTPPHAVDLTGPALIITGGEHRGIPPYLEKQCTDLVGIPMSQMVHSLNVSVAGAVLLYETMRQRAPARR